ncbi:MAG TPA: DUF1697 domain-containing protein [Caulobacteraceae bacterium]|nr:DUF1697 domain-containing protein [Caulobacteraceae bacterium]
MTKAVCLLRAVNVGGRKVVMSELRALAEAEGFAGAKTLLASGNLVVDAGGLSSAVLSERLEAAFQKRFGFHSEFICRTAAEWRTLMDGCPFPEDAASRGNRLLVLVSQGEPAADVVEKLQALAQDGERVARHGGDVWIAFTDGMADSRLMNAKAMKAFGTPTTGRNWNTVAKLAALAEA